MKKKTHNYINNKDFYNLIVVYREKSDPIFEETGKHLEIPNEIGKALLMIANNLSKSGKYSGYTWKDEFISDAVVNMVRYFHKFDYKKYNNPFAYFTMISSNAFIKRIKDENRKIKELSRYRQEKINIYATNEFDTNNYDYIDDNCKSVNQIFVKDEDYEVPQPKTKEKKENLLDKFLED